MGRFVAAIAIMTALACGVANVETVDIEATGVIRFVDVEGGCWVIISSDSTRYEPVNLDESWRVDSLFVFFRANRRADLATFCQVGELIEIVSISEG